MKKVKYSIITANYNGFNLMTNYFKSLENQTFSDFEVIIIDDCSTDDSYLQLLDYKKTSRLDLKIYKTSENGGPGKARNIGINKSNGEYITFVDNDDWIEIRTLELIDRKINEKKFDCIIYDYYIDNNCQRKISSSIYGLNSGVVDKRDALKFVRNHTVCKVYKRNIIVENYIKFPDIRRHEDIAFVGQALVSCDSFYYMKIPLYHYVQYRKSLSNNNEMDEKTLINAFDIIKEKYSNDFYNELREKSVTDLLYGVTLIMCKNKSKNKDIRHFISEYNVEYPNWYNCDIVKHLGKSKRIFLFFIKYKLIFAVKFLSYIHTFLLGG